MSNRFSQEQKQYAIDNYYSMSNKEIATCIGCNPSQVSHICIRAGQGMYFWDNVGNALYWKKQKMSHVSPDENVLIAECMLFLDRDYFCDLTNFEEEKKNSKK